MMETETASTSRTSRDEFHGRCRFCSRLGLHRYLNKEYHCYGFREVYTDLFMECFNLSLAIHGRSSKLICLSCIERLRDAYAFREVVVKAEQKLLDPLNEDDSEFVHVTQAVMDMKPEIKLEFEEDLFSLDLDPDECYNYTEQESNPDMVPGEAELLQRHRNKLTLPTLPASFKKHIDALRGKIIRASDVSQLLENAEKLYNDSKSFVSEKKAIMHNVTTVLQYSNVTPFKSKNTNGFPCLYCRQPMKDLKALRHHNSKEHQNEDLKTVLWKYGSESLVVYVDVTDLHCNICKQSIADIKTLKTHLIKEHSKKMYLKYADRIVPFKLTVGNYTCQICDCAFETFGSIERHMNVHYRNYICRECGSGFVTRYRLKVHIKSHYGGSFPCSVCAKEFKTHQKLKNHIDSVHRCVKRFKCPLCKERFTEYFARQRHLVEAHGAEPLKYKCNVCDRNFDRRFTLSRHLKKDHLEERNHQCEYCPYRCFTSTELKVHMIKHVGNRVHECAVCKKSYARKKTLTEHMRIHNNDRRHSCNVCGQAFIQKCSLKGHMKTHHPEYNVNSLNV